MQNNNTYHLICYAILTYMPQHHIILEFDQIQKGHEKFNLYPFVALCGQNSKAPTPMFQQETTDRLNNFCKRIL